MDLAGDEIGERAHSRARERVLGQQRRRRMLFVQPFDDRERLGEPRTVVQLERRQQRLRIDRGVLRLPVLALREMHELWLVGEALEVERDANAKGGRAAE